jgi:putative transposase
MCAGKAPLLRVCHISIARRYTYGARRVWHDVLADGGTCGLHRIERLMHVQALRARPRRRGLPADTGTRAVGAMAANVLDRQFTAQAPNQKWVADFTYIWTAEGWLYVAVVLDLFSRRVVGWSMSATMTAQLVTDALVMAIWRRGKPDALLHHSDRGTQGGFKRSSQQSRCWLIEATGQAPLQAFSNQVSFGAGS